MWGVYDKVPRNVDNLLCRAVSLGSVLEVTMKLEMNTDYVFIDIGNGYHLYLGTKKEVEKANTSELAQMVKVAVALNQYEFLELQENVLH